MLYVGISEKNPTIRFLTIVDQNRQVLISSQTELEGTHWPGDLGNPPEYGRILRNDSGHIDLVFPAFFARLFQGMRQHYPDHDRSLDNAKWIVLGLDASEAYAHHKDIVIQSIFVSMSIVILGMAAFFFFGMVQRYQLASASLEQLQKIKQHLGRFVPVTVQKLIEENPEQPLLSKVERDATVLFVDIDHYTKISEDVSPEVLNCLVETYFSVFLDIILSNGGEINETAGDGVMAIFTGKTPRAHALNAVWAAVHIREQAHALNREKTPQHPEILINIGINTGQVLLGATMIKGAVGERFTYTASGMVTNIAARLCDLGTKGEIHLGEATAQLVRDHCKLHGPLETRLKHVRDTIPVYQLA